MSDPQRYRTREGEARPGRKPLEAFWNIIGFLFAMSMGAAGYIAAGWFIVENEIAHWVYLPPELAWPAVMPYLGLKAAAAFIALGLGGAIYTLLYGLLQPVRGGRYDVEARESDLRGYRR